VPEDLGSTDAVGAKLSAKIPRERSAASSETIDENDLLWSSPFLRCALAAAADGFH